MADRDHGLKLLVRQVLDRITVLDLVLARDEQRQNLQVRGRLCSAHAFNRLRTAVPEVSEQGRNKLAVQLLTVTRANRTAGESLGPDDRDGLEDRWKLSIQHDQEKAIPIRELDATAHPPLQHNQLMSECHVLCLKSALRLERRGK